MPEGPEVEVVRRDLLKELQNKIVNHISLTELSQKYSKYNGKQKNFNVFDNQKLVNIERIGKFMIWKFDTEQVILNHLGMSGKWLCLPEIQKEVEPISKFAKVIVEMKDPPHAIFDDTRNFGQFQVFDSLDAVYNHKPIIQVRKGIDSLERPFKKNEFIERLNNPRLSKSIGEILLNQRLVSGIGNIYKSESLFEAGINPTKKVGQLTNKEKEKLADAIVLIIDKAIEFGGSTFGGGLQEYVRPRGKRGEAQQWHQVYGRKEKLCGKCKSKIVRVVQKDRSTFFCPKCQK